MPLLPQANLICLIALRIFTQTQYTYLQVHSWQYDSLFQAASFVWIEFVLLNNNNYH